MPEPRSNQLIAALPQAEYQRLLPHLNLVSRDAGAMIATGSGSERLIYFPVDCAVNMIADENGLNEIAIIGNEGAVGISLILIGESSNNRYMVINAGHVYELKVAVMARHFPLDSPLQQLLFNYSQILITQMGQNAYCRHHHSMEQRLSRWLLDCLGRVPSSPLQVGPQLLAEFFGVPAENLIRIVQGMQGCGLKLSNSHIVVTDPNALQACACECHTLIQAKISQWLPRVNVN